MRQRIAAPVLCEEQGQARIAFQIACMQRQTGHQQNRTAVVIGGDSRQSDEWRALFAQCADGASADRAQQAFGLARRVKRGILSGTGAGRFIGGFH